MSREEERKRLINVLGGYSSESRCERHGNPFGDDYCKGCKYESEKSCEDSYRADYLLANGIIVPPVSIGQKVYIIEGSKVRELYVVGIGHYKDFQNFTAFESFGEGLGCGATFDYNDIGRIVFLSKEEAEKHL